MVASKVFLYFCLCFVGGIFLNSFFNISQATLLGFLILGIFFISVFWKKWKLVIIGFCILFLVSGIWRHEIAESKVVYPEEKEIVFSGIVVAESDIRTTNIKLTVKSKKDQSFGVYGKVLITTDRYPEYQYGDKLKIKGRLQAPPIFDEFNYQD